MKWFKHDTDASIDAKLQELLLDYGACGYGLYWYCVELIAQNVDEKNITFELEHDARIIARNLNLTLQETKDMMSKMIELDLFSISSNEKLACYTLAKRLDQSMTSNKGFREVISKIKAQSHDGVMISHDKVMQEEKRREENIIEQKPKKKKNSFSLSKSMAYENLSEDYRKMLHEYILNKNASIADSFYNYHISKGSLFKDWSRAYNTWCSNDKKFNESKQPKGSSSWEMPVA